MVNRSIIQLLTILCAAHLCLQTALARPIEMNSAVQPPELIERPTIAFTLFSLAAGQYVKMLENGSVMATGQEGDLSAEWLVRMNGDRFMFENAEFRNHFLLVTDYQNTTVLHGHDIRTPLTRSSLEEVESASGEGNSTSGEGNSTVVASGEGETNSTVGSGEQEQELPVFLEWHVEYINLYLNRFRILMGEGKDCFLAFDGAGHPVKDFCQESADSSNTFIGVGIKGF